MEDSGDGDRLARASQWYAQQGWKIHPCYGIVDGRCTCGGSHQEPKDVGKHPRLSEWQNAATDDVATVQQWWTEHPESNLGVFCRDSGFFVIDVDPRSGGEESFLRFEAHVEGNLPPTVEALTGVYTVRGRAVRGRHLFYRCDPSEQLVGNLGKDLKGVDIKHNGYVLINPSNHGSGNVYEWVPGHAPWEIEMAQAPEELLAALRKRSRRSASSAGSGGWLTTLDGLEFAGERIDIDAMMNEGLDEGQRAVDLYKMTCAVANRLGVKDDMSRMAVETFMIRFNAEKVRPPIALEGSGGLLSHVRNAMDFVAANPKTEFLWPGIGEYEKSYAVKATEEAAETFAPSPSLPTALTGGVLPKDEYYRLPGTVGGAVEKNLDDVDSIRDAATKGNIDIPKDPDALHEVDGGEPGKRSLTDTGNGRRLIDTFGSAVRYTAGLGWFHWSQAYWKPDAESLEIQELAKRISPVIASEVVQYEDPDRQGDVIKWAMQSKSNARLKSTVENANSDPRIIVPVEHWDSDENLLGVANGVIDLRNGELLRGRPDLYITKRAPVAYSPGMRNVMWEQFLDFATDGDKEFQDWLQRAAGYSLTGSRKYDVMFLVYGPAGCLSGDTVVTANRGGNGKRQTLSDLYYMTHGGKRSNTGGNRAWNPNIPTMLSRHDDDGSSRLGRMEEIVYSGVKTTYTLSTAAGNTIRATADHLFQRPDLSFTKLGELKAGDLILVRGDRTPKMPQPKKHYRATYTTYHPNQKTQKDGYKCWTHRLVMEAHLNNLAFGDYIAALRTDPIRCKEFLYLSANDVVHHINHDHLDNRLENLALMTSSAHHQLHAEPKNLLLPIVEDVVTTIELWGEEDTYDIVMADDPHNFIANEFVVHNSGKNTLVEALVKCMGTQQYAWPLDSSILAAGDGTANSTDLYHWAELRGRRMVWVDELPDSERLKENSVKKLTGSSEISARSPGEKPFTFASRAKLWVTTNHRPIINDDAMWRRIRPIPLIKVPENPNPDLKEYIFDPEGALPAVLSWAVEGAIKIASSGSRDALGWCTKVTEAAEMYRKNEDRIGIFLSEETNEAEGASVPIKSLFAMYRMWSEERGEKAMTQIAFQRKLGDRNMDVVGLGSRAVVNGYSLAPRAVPTSEVDWDMAARRARIL